MLKDYELIKFNEWAGRGDYELTKKGKLILGELSLNLFIQFQEPLILERHDELDRRARRAYEHRDQVAAMREEIERLEPERLRLHNATYYRPESGPYGDSETTWDTYRRNLGEFERVKARLNHLRSVVGVDHETALVDLRLYRAQWRCLLKCQLYFLRINDGQLHKIGVTVRPIEERVAEISADLLPHVGAAKIEVLGVWPGRGNVELYFKHRYAASNRSMGSLTEYFKFDDEKPVLLDLRRMKKKEFSELELEVIANEAPALEREIYAKNVEALRRANIRKGMSRAARRGQSIGRPPGGEDITTFLARHQGIVAALATGTPLRQIARDLGVSILTVRKVRDAIND